MKLVFSKINSFELKHNLWDDAYIQVSAQCFLFMVVKSSVYGNNVCKYIYG